MTDDPARLAIDAGVPAHLARFGSPRPDYGAELEAIAEEHRGRRAEECATNGRHLDVVLESDEHPRCRHCSTSPLSRAELEAAGVVQAPDATTTVPRCCALDALAGYAASFTAVGDDDARAEAAAALAEAETRHSGHSPADA